MSTRAAARTFTETARREQIVEAAIATIARLGYARASYARIAEHAGLSSTGLISYHFASKDDLIDQVVQQVTSAGDAFIRPRVAAATGARAMLRAHIEANVEFLASNRERIAAIVQIFNALPHAPDGQPGPYAAGAARVISQLEQILREGQRNGELRRFSPRLMATTIRAAIDAVGYRLASDDDFDAAAVGRELADLFDRAARAGEATE